MLLRQRIENQMRLPGAYVANASGLSNCRAPTRTPSEALAAALPPVLVFGQIAFVIVVVTLIGSILLGQPVEYRAECAGKPRAGRFVAFIYRRDSLRASGATLSHAAPCIFFEAEFNASAESNAEQALHAVCEVAMEGL
jgi:hypothetical protein